MANLEMPAQKPSAVRYLIVGLATLMAVVLYMDRFCLGFFLTFIREELSVTPWEAGLLTSAFFWAYALGQVPAGWLSDRFGARTMLALYILLWSVFTGLMGIAYSVLLLIVYRCAAGLAQAGAYPTAAGMVSKWAPFSVRGTFSACIATGGRIGGFIAPILTAYLLIAFVPLSRSSLITAADILKPAALSEELRRPKPAQQALVDSIRAGSADNDWPASLIADDPAELARVLNVAVTDPSLYKRVDWRNFELPAQARALAEEPAENLSEGQITRRNRLLLQAAFPEKIRDIFGEGWRPAVYVYGIAGVVIALIFWLGVRNRPAEHPSSNEAEQRLIEAGKPSSPHGKVAGLPLAYILRCRSLWFSSLSQFCTNFGWVFLGQWLADYLARVHQVPLEQRGWMTSIPWVVGIVGMLSGGWLTDRLTRAIGLRWGRGLPMALTRFLAMAAYLSCLVVESPWAITAAFCVMAFATDLGSPAVWAFMQDTGGKHVGSVLGWGNMWGNIGAAVSPMVLGGLIEISWNYAFLACAIAFFISGIAALGVDATLPVVPPDEE